MGHIGQRVQGQRVARCQHQPLCALGKPDDLVQARLQQGFVGALAAGLAASVHQRVKPGQDATALVERTNRIHAAGKPHVKVQARRIHRAAQGVFSEL